MIYLILQMIECLYRPPFKVKKVFEFNAMAGTQANTLVQALRRPMCVHSWLTFKLCKTNRCCCC